MKQHDLKLMDTHALFIPVLMASRSIDWPREVDGICRNESAVKGVNQTYRERGRKEEDPSSLTSIINNNQGRQTIGRHPLSPQNHVEMVLLAIR